MKASIGEVVMNICGVKKLDNKITDMHGEIEKEFGKRKRKFSGSKGGLQWILQRILQKNN